MTTSLSLVPPLPSRTASNVGSRTTADALLSINVSSAVDHVVVALSGELDIATAPQLSRTIRRLLAEGRDRMVVDLDAVTFMDGRALGVLIAAHHEVTKTGGSLDITHNPLCARLLKITRMTDLFTIQ